MQLYKFDDKELRIPATPVVTFDLGLRKFAYKMAEFLSKLNGYALAANQVGDNRDLIVIDRGAIEGRKAHREINFLMNTSILSLGDEMSKKKETCLSFPGRYVGIERSSQVEYKYCDLDGSHSWGRAVNSLLAHVIQHECDHLLGKVLTDHGELRDIGGKK